MSNNIMSSSSSVPGPYTTPLTIHSHSAIVSPGVNQYTVNSGTTGNGGFGSWTVSTASVVFDQIKKQLLDASHEKIKEAIAYRDTILLTEPVTGHNQLVINPGDSLRPIIIAFIPEPSSFEWYLDDSKICTEKWVSESSYEIPAKHKFIDCGIFRGSGYIVPMSLVLRPVDLTDDRFFFSWYGGFVVSKTPTK